MEKKILIGALLTLIILFGVYIYRSPSSPQCEELDKNMRKLVEDANYCSVDSDCMIKLAGFERPFGCYDLFNKNVDLKTLETQVNAYVNKCYDSTSEHS